MSKLMKVNCEPAFKKLFEKTAKQAGTPKSEAATMAKAASAYMTKKIGKGTVLNTEAQAKLNKLILSIKLTPKDLKDKEKAAKAVEKGLGPMKKMKVDPSLKIVAGRLWFRLMKLVGTEQKMQDDGKGQAGGGVRG